ncbi:hypothetical protein SLS55_010050 [Diplodia seriata]|uniref:Uncharacterized protein n=1 Tax=Diplodia seriata TaxID=420778 RepID=A0ABR3C1V0_9PEZI
MIIRALREVLEKDYQFSVQWEQLKEEDEVGLQLEYILAKFMYESEGPRNLCIVYYAGHGFGGNNDGELNITK